MTSNGDALPIDELSTNSRGSRRRRCPRTPVGLNRQGQLEGAWLSDRSIAEVVKRACKAVGLKPSKFSGHSLRAGLATSAAMADVEERSIQEQTGHKSLKVLRTYIREGSLFRNNAARKVGL